MSEAAIDGQLMQVPSYACVLTLCYAFVFCLNLTSNANGLRYLIEIAPHISIGVTSYTQPLCGVT